MRVGVRLVSRSGSEVPPLHSAMGGTGHSILGEQIPSSTPKRTLSLHFRVWGPLCWSVGCTCWSLGRAPVKSECQTVISYLLVGDLGQVILPP